MFVWCYLPSYFRGELGTWLHEPGRLVHYAVMTGCRLDFYCLVPVGAGILYLPSLLSCAKVDMFIVIGSCWNLLYWNKLEGFGVFLVCLHTGSLTLTHWQFWRRTLLSLPLCLWNSRHYNLTILWSLIQKNAVFTFLIIVVQVLTEPFRLSTHFTYRRPSMQYLAFCLENRTFLVEVFFWKKYKLPWIQSHIPA